MLSLLGESLWEESQPVFGLMDTCLTNILLLFHKGFRHFCKKNKIFFSKGGMFVLFNIICAYFIQDNSTKLPDSGKTSSPCNELMTKLHNPSESKRLLLIKLCIHSQTQLLSLLIHPVPSRIGNGLQKVCQGLKR